MLHGERAEIVSARRTTRLAKSHSTVRKLGILDFYCLEVVCFAYKYIHPYQVYALDLARMKGLKSKASDRTKYIAGHNNTNQTSKVFCTIFYAYFKPPWSRNAPFVSN